MTTVAAQRTEYPFDTGEYPLATVPGPGQLDLGTVQQTARTFTLNEQALSRHVEIAGATGTGKTTLLYQVVTELDAPFWAFDRKQDYRQLIRTQDDVLVVPWEKLGVNPLIPPPGVSLRLWTWIFAELFGHAHSLLSASKNRIKYDLTQLYREHGFEVHPDRFSEDTIRDVVAGERSMPPDPRPDPADVEYPTLADLRNAVADGGDGSYRDRQYESTITNRMRDMTDVAGPLFTAQRNPPLEALMERNVVWEIGQAGTDIQNFLMEYLLLYVYTYRLANDLRDDAPLLAVVVDEAKRLFSKHKEQRDAAGEPLVNDVLEKVRGFNIGVLIASQEPRKLTETVRANTYTKILFRLESGAEFDVMAEAMGLSTPQRRFAQSTLDVGNALVSVGSGETVPVEFDYLDTGRPVQYTELVESQHRQWNDLLDHRSSEPVNESGEAGEAASVVGADRADADETGESPPAVSADVHDLLVDIVREPFRKVTDRYDLFSSNGKAFNVKQQALAADVVREKWVQDGSKFKMLELTTDGREYLRGEDVDVSHPARGGIVHRYWQHQIHDALTGAGYEAEIESDNADVAVDVDGRRVAVEVAMEASPREVDHVEERLADGFEEVCIACRNGGVRSQLRDMLEATELYDETGVRLLLFQEASDADWTV